MAWIASLFQDGCDYARLEGENVNVLTGSSGAPYLEVGFNGYREPIYYPDEEMYEVRFTDACVEYSGVPIDWNWKLAKIFAFFSLVFGGGGALFLWFSSCFVFGPGTWRWAGYEVFAASIFQCFAFLWFNNAMCKGDNKCSFFFGSKSDIVAALLWLISAVAIFTKYPVPAPKTVESGPDPNVEIPVAGAGNRKMAFGEPQLAAPTNPSGEIS
eukprot:CAMPEP_0195530772 /NCGR_PEP_ID=MMETSP0794_2-20130614/33821_1 /TAXON_ID=515487 /ORGANISM="Stephanopyxis turris, Strain CCMP 815" /LENGTH=212 /DNA_ID=CAMNT_0040662351 /DNA_START=205 /DNA_END=843 /DNA_ORIENTATION=+